MFQTWHIKWEFINIFYIALFQIPIKCDLTVLWFVCVPSLGAAADKFYMQFESK
jgi:hypothetical protein